MLQILRDTIEKVGDVCILVKYSSKREKMLGKITDNIEGKFDNQQTSKLDTTCVTG